MSERMSDEEFAAVEKESAWRRIDADPLVAEARRARESEAALLAESWKDAERRAAELVAAVRRSEASARAERDAALDLLEEAWHRGDGRDWLWTEHDYWDKVDAFLKKAGRR